MSRNETTPTQQLKGALLQHPLLPKAFHMLMRIVDLPELLGGEGKMDPPKFTPCSTSRYLLFYNLLAPASHFQPPETDFLPNPAFLSIQSGYPLPGPGIHGSSLTPSYKALWGPVLVLLHLPRTLGLAHTRVLLHGPNSPCLFT